MYLYKCDICGHVQEADEKFYHLHEIANRGDRSEVDFDFCSKCFKRFQNSVSIEGDQA